MDEIVLLLQELNENGRHNIIFTLYLSLTFNIKCCSYEILFSIAISVQRLVDCQLLLADERREADREQLRLLRQLIQSRNTPLPPPTIPPPPPTIPPPPPQIPPPPPPQILQFLPPFLPPPLQLRQNRRRRRRRRGLDS